MKPQYRCFSNLEKGSVPFLNITKKPDTGCFWEGREIHSEHFAKRILNSNSTVAYFLLAKLLTAFLMRCVFGVQHLPICIAAGKLFTVVYLCVVTLFTLSAPVCKRRQYHQKGPLILSTTRYWYDRISNTLKTTFILD